MKTNLVSGLLLSLCIVTLAACGGSIDVENPVKKQKPGIQRNQPRPFTGQPRERTLPPHKVVSGEQDKNARVQIRVVARKGQWSEVQFSALAVLFAESYFSDGGSSYVIGFFDDAACLEGWDGTETIRDSDWQHWLCHVVIGIDEIGQLVVDHFELGQTKPDGPPRDDVFRPVSTN